MSTPADQALYSGTSNTGDIGEALEAAVARVLTVSISARPGAA